MGRCYWKLILYLVNIAFIHLGFGQI